MVRRGRFSKGCQPCRKRKIKCDQAKPACAQCLKAGWTCPQYADSVDRMFQYQDVRDFDRSTVLPIRRRDKAQEVHMIRDLHKTDHRQLRSAHCSPVNVRSPNPRPEYCQLFTGLFWELYALQNSVSTRIMSFSSGWIRLLPAVTGRCKLLDDSVLALYSGFIGRQNNDPALVYYGMELHGEILRRMSQDRSWSAESGLKDVEYLLATIKVLNSYELLSTDSGEGYAAHILGGLQILEKSIHKLPKTSFSKMLIQRFRYIGYYAAIRHRKSFFLSNPPFSSIAPAEPDDPDYLFQTSIEALSFLPFVLEEADKLERVNDYTRDQATRAQMACLELIKLTSVLDKRFSAWLDVMKQATTPPVRSKPIPTANSGKNAFLSYWLDYSNDIDSFLWTIYWVLSLQLHQVIKQLKSRHATLMVELGNSAVPLPQDLVNLGADNDTMDQYADNICASLSPQIRASLGAQVNPFMAQESVAGVIGAEWYYTRQGDSKKAQWCVDLLNTIAKESKLNLVGVKTHFLQDSELGKENTGQLSKS